MNKIIWAQAFRERKKQVKLRDGRVFLISYQGERVKVKPAKGFIPTGEFLLKSVTDETWPAVQERNSGASLTQKGESVYTGMMREFVMSREKGVNVTEHWPNLGNRQVATLRQAFMRARTEVGKPARRVEIIRESNNLFLVKG